MPSKRLTKLLDQEGVAYELLRHRVDYTAQEAAADTHTPGREFAKTVVLSHGQGCVFAVLRATDRVDLKRAGAALGAKDVRLATEDQIAEICPDCEVGAMPPFGTLYGIPVHVDRRLAKDERITFNAGTHTEAIRMAYADFERLVGPQIHDLAESE